jgi:hypothetical protein
MVRLIYYHSKINVVKSNTTGIYNLKSFLVPFLLLLLWDPKVISLSDLERSDEGGYGSDWDGVHRVMGVIISDLDTN